MLLNPGAKAGDAWPRYVLGIIPRRGSYVIAQVSS
jgi:hypothetical protein